MKRPLKLLVIFDYPNRPPEEDYTEVLALEDSKCERDVVETLKKLGHEVRVLGIHDRIDPLIAEKAAQAMIVVMASPPL